ncbi:MAG: hypothetical protein JWM80_3495 [Cyanobacteria bacterium RYN_339]|nr:hypothetical protein [Cyanobacteria bacterium RYN_339]
MNLENHEKPAKLEIVKRAAAVMGVPYQTYIKQVLFQRAVEDITRYKGATAPHSTTGEAG